MGYLTGYTIKPYETTSLGEVFFTDGTNNAIRPNQQQCEAYGYTYDRASGTCSAFKYNTNLERTLNNINNKFNGPGNTTELGSNTIQINGTLNTAKGFNNNCLINGSNNTIANGVNYATVIGNNGKALRDGEFVIGSGLGSLSTQTTQTSIFSMYAKTTDATITPMTINSTSSSVTVIPRDSNALIIYTLNIIVYRTGGSSGSGAVGDRTFLVLNGILKSNTATEASSKKVSVGTVTGWTVASSFSGSDWSIDVTGAAAMDISWEATANFYEMKI